MRRPRCPKSAAIASKTSAEAKPLPSVNGPPRPTFETGAANGLKGKLFGYPDIPKLMDMTMRNFVLLLFICDESLNLHDFDDVFVDVTMSCCLSSCHRKTLADICHSKMPKRGNGIDGWNWTFNWFRFKDSNIFRWLEDQKKKVFPCLGELCELISPPSGSLLEKNGISWAFLHVYLGQFPILLPFMKHAELTTRISFWTLSILVNPMTHLKISKKAAS